MSRRVIERNDTPILTYGASGPSQIHRPLESWVTTRSSWNTAKVPVPAVKVHVPGSDAMLQWPVAVPPATFISATRASLPGPLYEMLDPTGIAR